MNVWSLFGSISLDSSGVTRGLRDTEQAASKSGAAIERDLGQRLERLQSTLNSIGGTFTLLSAPLIAFGATAIRAAGDFESSMNRVQGLTRATGDQFERLSDLARDLGATTAFSASEAADAMGNLATAGFNVEEIYDALPGVLELAAASGLDLADAAGIAATTLRGFGIEADEVGRVNDVLADTARSANTDVTQLGDAFQYVAPIANGLGFEFEETSAAIGLLSDAGIQASTAGTGLRSILTQLVSESKDLGIVTRDTSGNMLPLADILGQLETQGFTAEQAMAAFGETGGPALTALLSRGTDALRELNTQLQNSSGTAAELASTRMQGFNGAIAELSSAFEALQIAVAESGLLEFVTNLVNRLAGWLTTMSELNPLVLRIATIIAAVVASIGPLLLAAGKAVEVFLALRTGLTAVTTAITVLRTAMLAAAGPAGWIILGVTALAGLTAGFLATRDSAKEVEEQLGPGSIALERNARAIELVTAETERLTTAARDFITPIRAVSTSVMDSTDSVESLRSKVNEIADTLDGDAKTAFLEYAETAIASGDTLEEVGARIADRAARDSLLSRVSTLANDINENGRQAFINYALESIATADTAEEALDRIVQAWARAQVAGEEAVLATARSNIETELLTTTSNLNTLIDRRNGLLEQNAINQREVNRLRLRERRDAQDHTETIRLLNSTINTNNDYLAQSAGEVTILAERQATLRTELEANDAATAALNRTVEGITRTNQTAVSSGVEPLADANRALAESTDAATESSVKQRDEAAEAMAAAAAAAAAANEAIAEIDAANAAALGSITDGIEAASAAADAAAEALQRQANAAIEFVFTNIAAIDALIDSIDTFEFDYEELTASIEAAVSDARRISDGLTRQTELLADEIASDMNDLATLVNDGVEESDRIRGEIIDSIEDDVRNTGEEVLEFTENIVDGVEAQTNAVLDFLNRNAAETNELIDDIVDGTEDIRLGIEETSRAAAEAEFPDYARFAESTMELAEETANLTRRKFELGLVTENELIRAFDDYAIAIGMEMDFVGAQSESYLGLAERLREVVALKNELLGITGEGGDLPTGIATGIQAILDHFADQLGYVSEALTGFGNVVVRLFDTLTANVPLLGDLLSGFSISLDEATNAVSLTFDPFTILAEILMTVIDASEAVRAVFERTLEALQPFIDVVGSVIAIALEPFLAAVVDLLTALQPVIVAFVDLLGYALEPITAILTDVFKPLIEALSPLFVALFDALKPLIDVASSLFSAFGSLLTGALKPITWIIQNVLAPVLNGVAAVIRGVYNALATVINTAVAILTLGRVRNLVPLIGSGPSAPPGGFPDLREPRPEPPPPAETIPIPVGPPAPVEPPDEPPDEPPGDRGPQPPDDTLIGIPRIPRKPPGTGGGTPGDRYPDGPPRGGGGGRWGGNKPSGTPPRTPTPPAPTPPTPTPVPPIDRPTVFPDPTPAVFTGTSQGVQFAVATPIVEASIRMLQAANLLAAAVGGGDLTRDSGFDALPPFTASLERLTPLLDRLILEGVEIRMPTTQTFGPRGITKALRPL